MQIGRRLINSQSFGTRNAIGGRSFGSRMFEHPIRKAFHTIEQINDVAQPILKGSGLFVPATAMSAGVSILGGLKNYENKRYAKFTDESTSSKPHHPYLQSRN